MLVGLGLIFAARVHMNAGFDEMRSRPVRHLGLGEKPIERPWPVRIEPFQYIRQMTGKGWSKDSEVSFFNRRAAILFGVGVVCIVGGALVCAVASPSAT
jgi:hypothetical protein